MAHVLYFCSIIYSWRTLKSKMITTKKSTENLYNFVLVLFKVFKSNLFSYFLIFSVLYRKNCVRKKVQRWVYRGNIHLKLSPSPKSSKKVSWCQCCVDLASAKLQNRLWSVFTKPLPQYRIDAHKVFWILLEINLILCPKSKLYPNIYYWNTGL